MKTYKFKADVNEKAMQAALDFTEKCLSENGVSHKIMMQINVAVDELFSNIIKYSKAENSEIEFEFSDDKIIYKFIDNGTQYNPLLRQDPNISLSADERSIGGLGIFIVKKTMDSMEYEYKDGQNILTIKKSI